MNPTRKSLVALPAIILGILSVAEIALAQVTTSTIDPAYAANYTATDLGAAPVRSHIGGILFMDDNTLLLAVDDDTSTAEIDALTVTRGADHHITGFGATATKLADSPFADGGLQYGPNGVLLFTGYPANTLGQLKNGSSTPDKTSLLTTFGVTASVGGMAIVPAGFSGAGNLKLTSWDAKTWFDSTLVPDGSGTYNVTSVSSSIAMPYYSEGISYVKAGTPLFTANSVLIAADKLEAVYAYQVDANGDPILATGKHFADISNAYGMTFDPVTGDLLVSTELGVNSTYKHITLIEGFNGPAVVPEPGQWMTLSAGACLVFAILVRRRRAARA